MTLVISPDSSPRQRQRGSKQRGDFFSRAKTIVPRCDCAVGVPLTALLQPQPPQPPEPPALQFKVECSIWLRYGVDCHSGLNEFPIVWHFILVLGFLFVWALFFVFFGKLIQLIWAKLRHELSCLIALQTFNCRITNVCVYSDWTSARGLTCNEGKTNVGD